MMSGSEIAFWNAISVLEIDSLILVMGYKSLDYCSGHGKRLLCM